MLLHVGYLTSGHGVLCMTQNVVRVPSVGTAIPVLTLHEAKRMLSLMRNFSVKNSVLVGRLGLEPPTHESVRVMRAG